MPINFDPPKGTVTLSLTDYHKLTEEVEKARAERLMIRRWMKAVGDFLQLVILKENLFEYITGFNKRYSKEGVRIINEGGNISIKLDFGTYLIKGKDEEVIKGEEA